ncbi:hypothetical protein QQ054_13030 [Oscillatoria amoena NRMC-F 0135]|nr:MAG: hypothetical protein F9K23_18275 [Bacteroidota bacterium]MDL5046944.1 hypothetical protein [Oscillatoria amoena NRMC-F 0135]
MMQPAHRWNDLQQRAKLFLNRPAYKYSTMDTDKLPQTGGVYLICLVDDTLEETPLYINFTSNLRNEILTKRTAFILTQLKSPQKAAEVLKSNCYLRYIAESDPKEQMALTVAISLELKPLYLNN